MRVLSFSLKVRGEIPWGGLKSGATTWPLVAVVVIVVAPVVVAAAVVVVVVKSLL